MSHKSFSVHLAKCGLSASVFGSSQEVSLRNHEDDYDTYAEMLIKEGKGD